MDAEEFQNVVDWVEYGIEKGWVGKPRCMHHDGMDLTEEEDKEMDEGFDPCIVLMRFWAS